MSGNLDAPEGGFDAIMQVVACKVRIQHLSYGQNSFDLTTKLYRQKIRKSYTEIPVNAFLLFSKQCRLTSI